MENFIDTCLSLENLIDLHASKIRRRPVRGPAEDRDDETHPPSEVGRLPVPRRYLETFINPAEFIEEQKNKLREERKKSRRFPPQPERDVLLFLMEHAPLSRFQRDILGIIREEAYYFAPQGQTKIMNEGWATYWHSTIMTTKAMDDSEVIDFAQSHAGTLGGGSRRLNPYKLGLELYYYIEEKWNTGRFGKEFAECEDMERKSRWNKHLGLGREKIFEVRKHYNDVTFIDEFMDEEFCYEKKLFGFDYNKRSDRWEISTRKFEEIKKKLLFSLTNFGQPIIEVVDSNHANRGELLLAHKHEGLDLDMKWAKPTMEALFRIWSRPVLVRTDFDGKPVVLKYDGKDHSQEEVQDDGLTDP